MEDSSDSSSSEESSDSDDSGSSSDNEGPEENSSQIKAKRKVFVESVKEVLKSGDSAPPSPAPSVHVSTLLEKDMKYTDPSPHFSSPYEKPSYKDHFLNPAFKF